MTLLSINHSSPCKPSINTKFILGFTAILAGFLVFAPDALAMHDADTMREGLTRIERTLTGSWLRIGLLTGVLASAGYGIIKQSPVVAGMAVGIAVLALFSKDWISATFTAVI